jgi:hypothetical protein
LKLTSNRRFARVVGGVLCTFALFGAMSSSANAASYNCGQVAHNSYCNAPLSAWGPVHFAWWTSTTAGSTWQMPVRINRGSIGPTAWQWMTEAGWAQFPYRPSGVAQVKNTVGSTQQLTINWSEW